MGWVLQDGLGVSGVVDCGKGNVMELPQVGPQGLGIAEGLLALAHHSCRQVEVYQAMGTGLPLGTQDPVTTLEFASPLLILGPAGVPGVEAL